MKKNNSVRGLILISLVSLVPMVAVAQIAATDVTRGIGTFGSIITAFNTSIVRGLVTLFATMAMAAFFYGIVQYIWGVREGVEKKIKDGNQFILWGMVALFVMFSVWGIIIYVQTIFGIQGRNDIIIPSIQIGGSATTNNNPSLPQSPAAVTPPPAPAQGGVYACSPGFECTLSGGGIGICSTDGRACVQNQCDLITTQSACSAASGCEWSFSDLSCAAR